MKTKEIVLFLVIFVIASVLLWLYFWNYHTPQILSDFGQFYSGTIGIIFAITAAIIAFKTYNQQVKVTQYQNFENIFFKMLEMNEKNVSLMDLTFKNSTDKSTLLGKKSFERLYIELKNRYNFTPAKNITTIDTTNSSEDEKLATELKIIQDAYIDFSNVFLISVGPYLRHLFYLICYVNEQPFLKEKKKLFYINMIRIQLSANELLILFYACLSKRGYEKFKPLVEKYGILSHIEHFKEKLFSEDHIKLFDKKAFVEPSNKVV